MQPSNIQLNELVKDDIPRQFLFEIVVFLFNTYKSAHLYIKSEFGTTDEAKDLLPYFRRARIEQGIRLIAERHAKTNDTIKVRSERNGANNCSHNEIICGRVLITESCVDGPNEMVPYAAFRTTLAKDSQLELALCDNNFDGDFYYGIILHGALNPDTNYPSFVRLAFPNRDCKTYAGFVDLIDFCEFDVSMFSNVSEEVIDDKISEPEFRTDLQKQKEA